MRSVTGLEALLTEEACLQEVLRLRYARHPCKACDAKAGYRAAAKHRAFACLGCGFQVYPCLGTPFGKPEPTLKQWFLAIYLAAGQDKLTARDLKQALNLPSKAAQALLDDVLALKEEGDGGPEGVDWFDGIRDFTENLASDPKAMRAAQAGAAALGRKTWGARLGERWQLVAVGGIAALALAGAGVGWLLVPEIPEEDTELVQATAILTLASDKPVLLVSEQVAQQLYDVTDIEAEPTSSPLPSIRLAPTPGDQKGTSLAESRPLSAPSVKLAPSIGQLLLKGDYQAVKSKGGEQRPELAAYNALAIELEKSGPRNPEEILTFGPIKIKRYLVEKVVKAARETGMDPVLLMAIADKESSFATEVQASTSSATGLFQFIQSTWLGVVRDFGAAHGLDKDAKLCEAPSALPAGERTRILDLRRDAYYSAVFAAEMLLRDRNRIAKRLGRPLSGGETYLIHFLGPDGAERLLERVAAAPTAAAAELLPKPAEANKTIFYTKAADGAAKQVSVSELKEKFETMISMRVDRYKSVHGAAGAQKAASPGGAVPPGTPPVRPR